MAQPPLEWWQAVFIWLKDNTIMFMCFALSWKGIDKAFKYFSDSRDEELRKIVHEEMRAPIDNLSQKVDALSDAIWGLKTKG